MTMLSAIRDRFSPSSPASGSAHDASAWAAGDGDGLPFAGYDRLDAKQVKQALPQEALPDHAQIELTAVESYERSHRERGRP
jgi:hypothetical protein